ncbi:MAG: beta-ketoacyl-ACP synthase [Methylococcales bacterium]
MHPVAITDFQCISAAGADNSALLNALFDNQSRLAPLQLFTVPFTAMVGEVTQSLPEIRSELKRYDCRNAQLALAALNTGSFHSSVEQSIERYGEQRVGVVIGTSTSGIYNSEAAYTYFNQHGKMPDKFRFMHRHFVHATAEFIAQELALNGPCYAISTACSSSAKTLAAAQRLINCGICDAVVVGGVDTLCRLTLYGFNSLDLIAEQHCTPMDQDRNGINIGEAAGLLLLEVTTDDNHSAPQLLAVGESCDAHHMSAPHPSGDGAELAMRAALDSAGVAADQVNYINLHATASSLNDFAEAQAVQRVFGTDTPCSGLKGLLGHTLGASGALETIVTLLALQHDFLPGTCGLKTPDSRFQINLLTEPQRASQLNYAVSNAFGFGGNNASVLLSQTSLAQSNLEHKG